MSSTFLSNARRLRAFHEALGLCLPDRPQVPTSDVLTLRRTLIDEEYAEVTQEFAALTAHLSRGEVPAGADLSALVHELVDLLYVTYGALDVLGVDADAAFAEVHQANLAKTSGPKREDGKQLKPEGWQPANMRAVLERQLER
ncbi:hypothetical protein GCM10008955_22910 [Deinococcus malanensis]|uniref:HAD family hydrolase n=1 Tax=Deinococcus malanensis TaxID=1706855 RepID=A0ABQ2EWQ5_9DEIO|nr:hypothetical protein [Deinococcus malanensis]GGK28594.1 hypothetical protein GCM10008955_22910 [Deinococcus malanensis]